MSTLHCLPLDAPGLHFPWGQPTRIRFLPLLTVLKLRLSTRGAGTTGQCQYLRPFLHPLSLSGFLALGLLGIDYPLQH